ncbi:MAG TPA: DUF5615 family PIN-like protein [Patescibacteria group bacterium]|nr:DUF5615 family PIN-like protein [Patescibacteria group bacterium]
MIRQRQRFNVLFDEGLYPREKLPRTNERHNIRHIKHDFNYGGLSDDAVYEFAKSQNRLIATLNIKDFRKLLKSNDTGIIGISSTLTPDEIDKKLCSLLNKSRKGELYGKVVTITKESGKKYR